MFVIDVTFKSRKHWASFDFGERKFADDGETNMRIATHDPMRLRLWSQFFY